MKIFTSPEPDKEIFKRFLKRVVIAIILVYPIFLINVQMHRWMGPRGTRGYNDQKIERNIDRFWIESIVFSFILAFVKEGKK